MKKHFTLLTLAITFLLSTVSLVASAQTASQFFTASDATSNAPATASAVNQVICSGSDIKIQFATPNTGSTYEWYKYNSSGTAVLVKSGDATYNETPSEPGYYKYTLVEKNGTGCSSPASAPYVVYVLPPLNITLDNPQAFCETTVATTTTLKVTGMDETHGYTYTYKWYKGTDRTTVIGTQKTYDATDIAHGSYDYTVVVSFVLNNGCTASKTATVTVNPLPSAPTITFAN